jgi:hypothetical protein
MQALGMLTTKELLDEAEAQLNLSTDQTNGSVAIDAVVHALQSIAASQLVIARARAGIRAR